MYQTTSSNILNAEENNEDIKEVLLINSSSLVSREKKLNVCIEYTIYRIFLVAPPLSYTSF